MYSTIHSPLDDVLEQFDDLLGVLISPFSYIAEDRTAKKAANEVIKRIKEEVSGKNIVEIFEKKILTSMPEGIWNIETITIIESKFNLLFSKGFIESLKTDPKFNFKDSKTKDLFLRKLLVPLLRAQTNQQKGFYKQLRKAAVRESDMKKVRVARELARTTHFLLELTEKIRISAEDSKSLTSKKFLEDLKTWWIVNILLFLRYVDIVNTYEADNASLDKKLRYLAIERRRAEEFSS